MINDQIRIPINGVRQYISIRSEQERAPLLLYLHGGPGDTALPLVLKYIVKTVEKKLHIE